MPAGDSVRSCGGVGGRIRRWGYRLTLEFLMTSGARCEQHSMAPPSSPVNGWVCRTGAGVGEAAGVPYDGQ